MSVNKRTFSTTAVAIVVIVAVFLLFFIWARSVVNTDAVDYSSYDANSYIEADANNGEIADHVKFGDIETAKVVIYEYADFQCPYCATFNPYITELVESYNGDVVIVFRNFNMSYHENSKAASAAAEAAAMQGYYEEYSEYLFTNQSDWEYAGVSERTDLFVTYFETVTNGEGDSEKFRSDMASSAVSKKITFDNAIANTNDVPGTPSFYINGEKVEYAPDGDETVSESLENFKAVIDAALAEAEATESETTATETE